MTSVKPGIYEYQAERLVCFTSLPVRCIRFIVTCVNGKAARVGHYARTI